MDVNKYIILNNPLLYADSDAEIQDAVNEIYNQVKNISYAPGTIELLEDYGINCGDIITCDGKTFYVMKKEITNSGVVLTCVGDQERTESSNLNKEIQALRGKSNTLKRDLESSVSTLTDITEGLSSRITQTASQIEAQIEATDGRVNRITQTLDGVVFYDSETGQTVIDGSHITTGVINASQINLTGSVDWGDLSSSCRSTIAGMSSSYSDSDVRSYLKRTLNIQNTGMNSAEIYAPRISGGEIYATVMYAGDGDTCYCKMGPSGFEVHTVFDDNSLFKLGYYTGEKWQMPYLTIGHGDDGGIEKGMVKKFTRGIWIGDSDDLEEETPTNGTGIFIDFYDNKIYKVISGTKTQL